VKSKLLRELLLLIAAAIALGFVYTFITKQGFFIEKKKSTPAPIPNLEMISLTKAKELFDSSAAIFVDARNEFEYKNGHIRGATNVALHEYETQRLRLNSIPKNKLLIAYCDGGECSSSIELAVKLMESGAMNVKVFFGGWQEWHAANFPIDK
jgi:rhodanese-related sulfurtransferase